MDRARIERLEALRAVSPDKVEQVAKKLRGLSRRAEETMDADTGKDCTFVPVPLGEFRALMKAAAAAMNRTDTTPAGSVSGEAATACWQAMGDENYLFGGGPFEDAHPDDQDAARRIAGAVLAAANVGRLRDALRCALDIGGRRLLLPSEVLHWQALLAEPIDAAIQGSANGQDWDRTVGGVAGEGDAGAAP